MGRIIEFSEFEGIRQNENNYLIFLSSNNDEFKKSYSKIRIVTINESLSKALITYKKEDRLKYINYELDKIVSNIKENEFIIEDFDILFNPSYKIDVIRWIISISRNKKVIILWNGVIKKQSLVYSEVGNLDYKDYNIKNYEILCVKGNRGIL